ncbi:hypothetical protein Barb6_00313 [Bacteroidales bacterium Barb6]|nr:hypothetical protein Barb6_00313 [Bacteroidales bacterium Barb6]
MWGYKDTPSMKPCKDNTNDDLQTYFCHPFRAFLAVPVLNPTFRFAACGAEISYPFGALRNIST